MSRSNCSNIWERYDA